MIFDITEEIFPIDSNNDFPFKTFVIDERKITSFSKNLVEIEKELGTPVLFMDQVHSDKVCLVNSDSDSFIKCDALITDNKDISIAVQTADCVPIIILEGSKKCVVHSGWKGTLNNIISRVLEHFDKPKIYIGPCIRSCCYEINTGEKGDGREEDFILKYGENSIVKRNSKIYLDLIYVVKKQIPQGLEVVDCNVCTCCSNSKIPSHFRDRETRNHILVTVLLP